MFALFCELRSPEFGLAGLPPTALAGLLRLQFASQISSYALQYPAAEDLVLCSGSERLGRMMVDRSGEAFDLIDLGLMASHRGQGTGTSLLNRLVEEARDRSVPLHLSVRHGNPAIRLYERLGFLAVRDNGMDLAMEYRPSEVSDNAPLRVSVVRAL